MVMIWTFIPHQRCRRSSIVCLQPREAGEGWWENYFFSFFFSFLFLGGEGYTGARRLLWLFGTFFMSSFFLSSPWQIYDCNVAHLISLFVVWSLLSCVTISSNVIDNDSTRTVRGTFPDYLYVVTLSKLDSDEVDDESEVVSSLAETSWWRHVGTGNGEGGWGGWQGLDASTHTTTSQHIAQLAMLRFYFLVQNP